MDNIERELVEVGNRNRDGVLVGKWMGNRIKKETFESIIVGLLGIAGVLLIFT